jgi:hypothetical protein
VASHLAEGGSLLVVDSIRNLRSTGNELLKPYNLALEMVATPRSAYRVPA